MSVTIASILFIILLFIICPKIIKNAKKTNALLENQLYILSAPYVFYIFLYIKIFHSYGYGYGLINKADQIIDSYWIIFSILLALNIFGLLRTRLKRPEVEKTVNLYTGISITIVLLFKPYVMLISFIDFAMFRW